MKNIKIIITLCLLLLSLFVLTSCSEGMEAPKGLVLDEDTQTLLWDEVRGAQSYTVKVSDGKEFTIYEEAYSLEYLAPGDYTIFVRANGDGEVVENSPYVKFSYRREKESGLKYQLINNGTEYQLVDGGSASGDVVMEAVFRGKPVTAIASKALYGNYKITSLTVSSNVKTIGEKAFIQCSVLTTVIIPDSVTSIGAYAFNSCNALKRITLPNSITAIEEQTFAWCTALTEVTVGRNLTRIEEQAFSNCHSLRKINYIGCTLNAYESYLPDSLRTIGNSAFTDCIALNSIHLGNGLNNIAFGAFMGCKSISSLGLGESVKTISESAFQNCEALTSVDIPNSTQKLANGAFYGCTALNEVTLGTGLVEIGYSVFEGTALYSAAEAENGTLIIDGWLIKAFKLPVVFKIPEGVYGVASYAASGNKEVQQLNLAGVKYVGYAGFHACESLFKATFDDSLLVLGEAAFNDCPYLSSITVGNSLTSIGDFAFYDCVMLPASGISLPETLTSIGMQAFRNTKAYKDVSTSEQKGGIVYIGLWAVDYIPPSDPYSIITMEEGTYGIANYTFANQIIMKLNIANSVEYICRGAFYKTTCYSLNLPESLKHIGDYAFYGAAYTNFGGALYELVIPTGTLTIGKSAFYSCGNVLSLVIPDTVISIGDYAFYDCFNLGTTAELEIPTGEEDEDGDLITELVEVSGYLTLNEGLQSIGKRAFQGTALVDVVIPDSVTELGAMAFYNCPSLVSIHFGKGITEIGDHMFYGNESLKTVVIAGTLDLIGEAAFQGCLSLKTVEIYGVREIGDSAFRACSALTSITLPDTLTTIGTYAFRGCVAMKSFFLPDSITTVGDHAFYGLNATTLYLEATSIPEGFHPLFNSSFRPVILGCTSVDGAVESFIYGKDTVMNKLAVAGFNDPCRAGYEFAGWARVAGSTQVSYTSENITEAEENTRLYAIWLAPVDEQ